MVYYLEVQSSSFVRFWVLSEHFSLFSQVGGFLGLLLGASILTVCEILDFILVSIAAALNERKTRGEVADVGEDGHDNISAQEARGAD